jgi:hypothetical protein
MNITAYQHVPEQIDIANSYGRESETAEVIDVYVGDDRIGTIFGELLIHLEAHHCCETDDE